MNNNNGKVLISRPKDRSLEAFKAWVNEIADHILGKDNGGDISEQNWKDKWIAFWQAADKK